MEDHGDGSRAADRQAITDCLLRYVRGVDRLDGELVRSALHEDGVICNGASVDTADEFFASFLAQQDGREITQHYLTNTAIDLDGDDVAHVETYFVAVVKDEASDEATLNGGRYADRFERRDGAWRIAVRLLMVEWRATIDASLMAGGMADRLRGTRDRRDPVYERPLRIRRPLGEPGG